MRIAIASDFHFGDPLCQLAYFEEPQLQQGLKIGPKYEAFCQAVGQNNDFLVLLGDIFDFSIASYEEAYKVARAFFLQIQKDQIARQILYIPGNHDFDTWHFYEYDVNVIRRVAGGRPPRPFRFSVPAIVDCRHSAGTEPLTLFGVDRNPESSWGYGGMFIDKITRNEDGSGTDTPFALAYPNAYLLTDEFSIMLTHGHYLEQYWSLVGEWALVVAGADLRVGDRLDLIETVALNFPLNQLACSGVGQAGPLSTVVRELVKEVKSKDLNRVKRCLDKLDDEIDRRTPGRWLLDPEEAARDAISNYGKKLILKKLEEMKNTRYSEEFVHSKDVMDRFRRFFDATLLEIDYLNQKTGLAIPTPRYLIFGHTHEPILWENDSAPWTQGNGGQPLTLYNTGGWLRHIDPKSGQEIGCSGAVFTFDSSKQPQMSSRLV